MIQDQIEVEVFLWHSVSLRASTNPSLVNGGTATGVSALDSECNRTTGKEGKGEVQVQVKFKLKCISHPVAAQTSVPVYVPEIHSFQSFHPIGSGAGDVAERGQQQP